MNYLSKYVKYKKKYVELRSQINSRSNGNNWHHGSVMTGGVQPFAYTGFPEQVPYLHAQSKDVQVPDPHLLKFNTILVPPTALLETAFKNDLQKCSDLTDITLSGGAHIIDIVNALIERINETTNLGNKIEILNEATQLKNAVNNAISNNSIKDRDHEFRKTFGALQKKFNENRPKEPAKIKKTEEQKQQERLQMKSKELAEKTIIDKNAYKILLYILEHYNGTYLTFTESNLLSGETVYMVNVNGAYDSLLNQLGEKFYFPRGFPIIWIPGKFVKMHGFYRKFENDERNKTVTETEFAGLRKMTMFKKWSGYLGQLCVFAFRGYHYWTAVSKKKSGNDFSRDAIRLFSKYINRDIVQKMIHHNLHICAEMLSMNDQTHGHIIRPEKETPVITMIATGNICNLITNEYKLSNGTYGKFINPYSITEIGNFCKVFNLPCDTGIIIEGQESIINFITEVQRQRDFMTDTIFENIIKNPDGTSKIKGVTLNKGLISHTDVVGDALEGLVLMLEYTNKPRDTKKYKFPIYTIRTMLIRELFGKAAKINMSFDAFVDSEPGRELVAKYMDNWVGAAGKKYWDNYFKTCMYVWKTAEFQQKNKLYTKNYKLGERAVTVDTSLFNAELKNTNNKYISTNILLAEEALRIFPIGTLNHPPLHADVVHVAPSPKQPLIIGFFGPVGFGKSTAMNKFCEWANITYKGSNKLFVPIDGDVMNLTDMEAMNYLKKEKNDYLNYLIVQQIILGNVPVVSHGGYVFSEISEYIHKVTKLVPVLMLCQMVLPENMEGHVAVIGDGDEDGGGGGKKEDISFSLHPTSIFINPGITDPHLGNNYKQIIGTAIKTRLQQTFDKHKNRENTTGWIPSSEVFYTDPSKKMANEVNGLISQIFKPTSSKFYLEYMEKINSNHYKYKCTRVNPETDMHFDNLYDVITTLLDGVHVIDPQNIKFTQYRYLVKYWPNGSNEWPNTNPKNSQVSFGHVTLKYSVDGVVINKDVISNSEVSKSPESIFNLVTANGEGRKISAIVLGKIERPERGLYGIEHFDVAEPFPKFLHVTVDNGIHSANLMGSLTQHILDYKEWPLLLKGYDTKTKSQIEVHYTDFSQKPYNVVFYKPYYV